MIVSIFTAFLAGCFGSALGALGAVTLMGLVAMFGVVSGMAGMDYNIVGSVVFGLILGPHVSFGPACAAAGFAKRMGYLEEGKDIATPLIALRKPSVLIVGGLFAVAGFFINMVIATALPGGIDSIAATIIVITLIGKALFSRDAGRAKLFGRTPASVESVGGRFSLRNNEIWLSYVSSGSELFVMGAVTGGLSAVMTCEMLDIAARTGNTALAGVAVLPGFAIGLICLSLLIAGLKAPVFQHCCLVASYGVLMSFNATGGDATSALLWGVSLGVLTAFFGNMWARGVCSYGELWVDPPTASIAFCSLVPFTVLPALGALSLDSSLNYGIPFAVLILAAWVAVAHHFKLSRAESERAPDAEAVAYAESH